jgi:AraC family transcriptional regulator, transcriptional activator of the genes for pyochelin and ferripyochelin receptors
MPRSCVVVSPEMLSFTESGPVPREGWPDDAIVIGFAGISGESAPTLRLAPDSAECAWLDHCDVVLVVRRTACRRLFGEPPIDGAWHLLGELRGHALAVRDCEAGEAARDTLRLARSIELLCQTFAALSADRLIPIHGNAVLSERNAARIAAARALIEERWQEKLTLDSIGRACGLNRDKLSRGFRQVFDCSVSDLLAEKRLGGARQLLIATDLPVSTVGYRCGYLNNASFTRAFTRRFGLAPSQLRQGAIAA